MGTPALWNIDGSSSSGSVIDNRRGTRTKARASSTGVAVLAPMVTHPRRNGPSPAKRRKSKPEPEEFRAPKDEHPQVGLGVIMGDETWPTERPQRCRTASDSNTLATTSTAPSTTDWPRSPTPPPVPNLPPQYRRPSSEGHFFASSLLSALGSKGNEKLAGAMESMLGLGRVELEEMRGELAGVYDKWKLVKGMRKVSLEDVQQQNELVSFWSSRSSCTNLAWRAQPQVSSPPIPSSPARSVETASFFTPSARRRDFRQPTAQPVYASLVQVPSTPHESPLASQSHHTRTRSLSSASMLAQGLVIKAQNPNPMLLRWPQPQVDPPTGGIEYNMTRVTSDGADSPSLQTPSTGQGGFPSAESMGSTNAAMGNMVHWRSATDPIHGTSYTVPHPQQIEIPTEWGQLPESEPGLDSPLAMTHSKQNDMPPPPQPLQHYHSHQFSTPHHPHARSARGVRQVMQVPFTPPTPLPMRGRSGIGGGGGIPMFYNPSFHPVQGMMPGGLGIGNGNGNDGGQRMLNGNGQGQVNGEMYRGVGGVGGLGGGDGRGYADGAYEEGYGRQQ